jgi:hypothetical protein
MKVFLEVVFTFTTIFLLFAAYMTWRRGWGKKHYLENRNVFPYSLIARFGERIYVITYKVSLMVALVCVIVLDFLMFRYGLP